MTVTSTVLQVSQSEVWGTIASLLLVAVALAVAAVLDRRRADEIVRDPSRLPPSTSGGTAPKRR